MMCDPWGRAACSPPTPAHPTAGCYQEKVHVGTAHQALPVRDPNLQGPHPHQDRTVTPGSGGRGQPGPGVAPPVPNSDLTYS